MNPIGKMLARAVTAYKRIPAETAPDRLPSWLAAYCRLGRYIVTGKA
jgi:hypothetical protein